MARPREMWTRFLWILLGFPCVRWPQAGAEIPKNACLAGCVCESIESFPKVDCSAQNLTAVPAGLSALTTRLDLSKNNLTKLPEDAFSNLKKLTELRLTGCMLTSLPPKIFQGLKDLRFLRLSENHFVEAPVLALRGLTSLQQLHLDATGIEHVPPNTFADLHSLKQLWLDANELKDVPMAALNKAPSLEALTLAANNIRSIPDYAFKNLTSLLVLLLFENRINHIGDNAFEGLSNLTFLDFHNNLVNKIPVSLASLPNLEELRMSNNKIEYLPDESFIGNPKLTILHMKNNRIMSIGKFSFANLPRLETLFLSEARDQVEFPDLTGTTNLEVLTLDRGSIESIPPDLCLKLGKLKSFDIHWNKIREIPDLSGCKELRTLNLGNNELTTLEGKPFRGLVQLRDLTLAHNNIEYIPDDAFEGLIYLQYLDLQHNRITEIHPDAFALLKYMEDLNLADNLFPTLPTKGLDGLKHLKTFNNKALKDFPSPDKFPRVQYLALSYAYHCCEFIKEEEESKENKPELIEDITFLSVSKDYENGFWRNLTNIWGPLANLSTNYQTFAEDVWDGFGQNYDFEYPENIPSSAAHYFSDYKPQFDAEDFFIARPPVQCRPMPGPFMPCDDLMGWWSLRCGVWIVFLLALLGNGTVLFVSILSRSKMDVPRFLICNLACADFFMGIYLGFLAIVDASTLGEFKKYAIKWQTSHGCLVAGFLGVLSSELSVFTLTVITLERFYAITHAMHLNKRLSIRHAGYIMACGWFLSLLLASMPLFGVSDYRKFAICLPFETGDRISLGYVCFIMVLNCIAFMIIVSCYMKMYCSIRGSQAWNSNDSRVAKRMALLVFTDFACWAPISFFSLTAAFGCELISLNDAKVFTIFVLPLNSCANPFLYAIFTKQFKKDCGIICKRLEETAMSRSLSRFSNRNLSLSWGSSRRPSALNSFFNVDKRESRSQSISGASAGHLDALGAAANKGTLTIHNNPIRRCAEEKLTVGDIPIIIANGGNPRRNLIPNGYGPGPSNAGGSNIEVTDPNECPCHSEHLPPGLKRGVPVGAGQGLLSYLRRKRGADKLGDGIDSDQEDGAVWVRPERPHADTLGLFPLLPLGESPGGARRPRLTVASPKNSPSTKPGKTSKSKNKSTSPSGKRTMNLNCCNGSPRNTPHSPGPDYQLMIHGDDSGGYEVLDNSYGVGDPSFSFSHSSNSDQAQAQAPDNNNHEYVNITEDMITELRRIREESSTSYHSDSPETSAVDPESVVVEPKITNVRLDPEGSESKEKVSYVKLDKTSPKSKGCQCKSPFCTDKPHAIDEDSNTSKKEKLKKMKSNSFDFEVRDSHPVPGCSASSALTSSSMPTLLSFGSHGDSNCVFEKTSPDNGSSHFFPAAHTSSSGPQLNSPTDSNSLPNQNSGPHSCGPSPVRPKHLIKRLSAESLMSSRGSPVLHTHKLNSPEREHLLQVSEVESELENGGLKGVVEPQDTQIVLSDSMPQVILQSSTENLSPHCTV